MKRYPVSRERALSMSQLLALLLLLALPLAAVFASDLAQIEPAALLERIEKKDATMIVLDVRTPEEYAAGHVPGAINIPHTHLPARIAEIAAAAEKDVVLYCVSGRRAGSAAERLQANGFTRLLHLQGDMPKWQEKKLPVEK
jgi:rhodanese-related sulfurtransferase